MPNRTPHRHTNVLQLVGGSIPTTPTLHPYLVFQTGKPTLYYLLLLTHVMLPNLLGGAFDYVQFLKETTSLHDVIEFVRLSAFAFLRQFLTSSI